MQYQYNNNDGSDGDEPIFFEPVFVHAQSDFATFIKFMGHLAVTLADCDTSVLCSGSDEEFALRKAMLHAFPKAHRLVCTWHLKENLVKYIQDV